MFPSIIPCLKSQYRSLEASSDLLIRVCLPISGRSVNSLEVLSFVCVDLAYNKTDDCSTDQPKNGQENC